MSRLVTMEETWLCHYDPQRKQQWMDWRHSGSPRPAQKCSEWKNSLEKFLLQFFGIKKASTSLIIFQRAKLSTPSITRASWWNWRIFWWKNSSEYSPSCSCSCTTMPLHSGHLQPTRNWPTWACIFLITNPFLRICPRRTTTCSLDWKTIEYSPFFVRRGGHCCSRDLLGGTNFWIILVALNITATDLEMNWASWEVCWINHECVRYNLFPSWSG